MSNPGYGFAYFRWRVSWGFNYDESDAALPPHWRIIDHAAFHGLQVRKAWIAYQP